MLSFRAATFWMNGPAPVEPLRLRRMPMFAAAGTFAAGIVLARQWQPPAHLLLALLLLLAVVVLASRSAPRVLWLPVLALWALVGCWSAQVEPPAHRPTALHPFTDGLSRTVRGRVLSTRSFTPDQQLRNSPAPGGEPWLADAGAWQAEPEPPRQSVDLAVDAIEAVTPDTSQMVPVTGGVRLLLTGNKLPLQCGDVLDVPVRLREPEVYRDPGAFSYADWLVGQGISASGSAASVKVERLRGGRPSVRCTLAGLQHAASDRLDALPHAALLQRPPAILRLTPVDTGMLAAMLFGDRTRLSPAERAGFERTGTFHLLVVSGLHISLVVGGLFALLRRFRVSEAAALCITAVAGLSYALLTGFGVPAQRALAMTLVYLLARTLDRQRSGLNALGTAAVLILAADPRALFTASFQMTALVIFAVAGLGVPATDRWLGPWRSVVHQLHQTELDNHLEPSVAARRVALRMVQRLALDLLGRRAKPWPGLCVRAAILLAETLTMSIAIEVCMALPMVLFFHRLTPLALPGNLLVAPLASVLLLGGILTFAAGLLQPFLALVPAAITALCLHVVQFVIGWLSHAHLGDLRSPGPPPAAVFLCAALAGFALWALRTRGRLACLTGTCAALLLPAAALWPAPMLRRPGMLEVTALDVGQGDSLLVVSPDGHSMLVDAGGPVGRVTTRWDVGEEVVAPYLWSRRIRQLDAVVVTHGHSDHIGGMPAILRDFHPRELWISLQPGEPGAVLDLLALARQQGIRVRWLAAGDRFAWGGTETTVISPQRGYANYGEARNDDSLVLQVNWGRASALLEGDAEAPSEDAMVASGQLHSVTLLKVGHHGSRTSTTPDFLAAVHPRAAVISVGQHNTFGHPRWEVLERLEAAHVQTFRTDRQGAETFLLAPDGGLSSSQAYN